MQARFVVIAFLFFVHTLYAHPNTKLQNGVWRAVLERKDSNNIVFNFEAKDSAGKQILYIRNAAERLLVDDIKFVGDSVFITLPFFEAQLRAAIIDSNELSGRWFKRLADSYQTMPFHAFCNQSFRFNMKSNAATANISGRWSILFFDASKKNEEAAVGEFVQQGNQVTGTFLTSTGDDRYLEGVMDGDSFALSGFDGCHAYLFTAKVSDNQITEGRFFSGPTASQSWAGKRNENAALADEFTLTKMKPGKSSLNFSFKDLDGKMISINDTRFKNKIILVQIMGSWCPNCMDETEFLSKLYEQYHSKGVEIIGLAYERSTDFARSQKSLRSFQKRFGVKYPILITGVTVSDPMKTEKTLPQLEAIVGFPTTIIINKKGEVEKIHTGFNGPGTGIHYEEQKKEFYDLIDGMLGK
jgi:thiol-disulfide isomerase/thioredoxin